MSGLEDNTEQDPDKKPTLIVDYNIVFEILSGRSLFDLIIDNERYFKTHFMFYFNRRTELSDELSALGLKIFVGIDTPLKLYNYIYNNLQIFKIVNKYCVKCVLANNAMASRICIFAKLFQNIKFYTHIRNLPIHDRLLPAVKLSDVLLAPSKFVVDNLNRQFPDHKSIYVGDGVMFPKFVPAKHNQSSDAMRIGMMARCSEQKGTDIFCRLAALALSVGQQHFQFHYAGATAMDVKINFPYLETPPSNLKFWGSVSGKDFESFWDYIDIFILPCRDVETFGRVVVEAQMRGKVVMTTQHGALSELVQDGVSGLLLPDTVDSKYLLQLLKHLYRNPDLAANLGNGAKVSAQRFSTDQYFKRYVDALDV